jgi:hypothetical protein
LHCEIVTKIHAEISPDKPPAAELTVSESPEG